MQVEEAEGFAFDAIDASVVYHYSHEAAVRRKPNNLMGTSTSQSTHEIETLRAHSCYM